MCEKAEDLMNLCVNNLYLNSKIINIQKNQKLTFFHFLINLKFSRSIELRIIFTLQVLVHLTDFLQVSPILFLLFLPPHFPLRYSLLNSPQIRLIQLLHLLLWGPFLRRESLVSSLLLGKLSLIALHWSNSKALDSHNSPEV